MTSEQLDRVIGILARPIVAILVVIAAVVSYQLIATWIIHLWPDLKEYKEIFGHVLFTLMIVFLIQALERSIKEGELAKERELNQQRLIAERESMHVQIEAERSQVRNIFEGLLRDYFPLGIAATDVGLKEIYGSRTNSLSHIEAAIKVAEHRILFLGVALQEALIIEEIGDVLRSKKANSVDVRLLLMNPLTSPAVFRAFIETPPEVVKQYVARYAAGSRSDEPLDEHYQDSVLYRDCEKTYKLLHNSSLGPCMRFYRRDPAMWMVIVDDRVFVEPYTFGRPDRDTDEETLNRRLGGHMPVLEFIGAEKRTFCILLDHFENLWNTTQDDSLHMGMQYARADEILSKEIFGVRLPWLTFVANSLGIKREKKRSAPRDAYSGHITIKFNGKAQAATLLDCSVDGISITTDDDEHLTEGATLSIEMDIKDPAIHILERRLFAQKNVFVLKHKAQNFYQDGKARIGLQKLD